MKPYELTKQQRRDIPITCEDWEEDAAIIGFEYQKKLLGYQNESCTEHPIGDFEHDCIVEQTSLITFKSNDTNNYKKWCYQHRYQCPVCIQSLLKDFNISEK